MTALRVRVVYDLKSLYRWTRAHPIEARNLVGLLFIAGSLLTASAEAIYEHGVHQQLKPYLTQRLRLQEDLRALETQKTASDTELVQKTAEEAALKAQIDSLNSQLQSRRSVVLAAAVPAISPSPPTIISGCGDNTYANYIYQHESSCNTAAINFLGCYGIGQACPGSKVSYCGTDYSCQNAWFSDYASRTYGGWYNAYLFWLSHHWW